MGLDPKVETQFLITLLLKTWLRILTLLFATWFTDSRPKAMLKLEIPKNNQQLVFVQASGILSPIYMCIFISFQADVRCSTSVI